MEFQKHIPTSRTIHVHFVLYISWRQRSRVLNRPGSILELEELEYRIWIRRGFNIASLTLKRYFFLLLLVGARVCRVHWVNVSNGWWEEVEERKTRTAHHHLALTSLCVREWDLVCTHHPLPVRKCVRVGPQPFLAADLEVARSPGLLPLSPCVHSPFLSLTTFHTHTITPSRVYYIPQILYQPVKELAGFKIPELCARTVSSGAIGATERAT